MADIRQRSSVARRLCWIAVLSLCIASMAAPAGDRERSNDAPPGHVLSLSAPTLDYSVDPALTAASERAFVQVTVIKVRNPQRIPISFEVYFRAANGKKIYLGNFSLFPPDNPGKFIVATRGLVEAGGLVSVTLVALQPVPPTQDLCVTIGSIRLIK